MLKQITQWWIRTLFVIAVTTGTEKMHLSLNTKYEAALRGPGHGDVYNQQGNRCRTMAHLITLP